MGLARLLAPVALAGCGAVGPDGGALAPPPTQAGVAPVAPAAVAPPAVAAPAVEPATEASPPSDARPRIGAIGDHVWIMPKPSHKGLALGRLRYGMSLALRAPGRIEGEGCARGWYAVEPRGYVCLNTLRTTLDLADPYYRALAELAPRHGVVWPYRYAHSRGAPMYGRVPGPEEWDKHERHLGPPGTYLELGEWAKGHEELIEKDVPIEATDPVPWFLEGGERRVGGNGKSTKVLLWRFIPNGSMLAYARAFEMHGRVWLVTPDLMVVPADRVQPMRLHDFTGVMLGGDVTLPLAWNRRKEPRPLYRRTEDGRMVESGETLGPKAWVEIAAGSPPLRASAYYALRDRPELSVRGADITITPERTGLPRGIGEEEKWLEARLLPGTLTAYVGRRPVYATLFSGGKGGLPVPGHDHTKYATTQLGFFRLEWKEWVATMSNEKTEPKVLWFTDVPHIQYVKAPLAMHVSYWHQDFGNLKSAECLNVSAVDGRWLFGFTEPAAPEGWNAVRPGAGFGPSTAVLILAN